MRRPGSAKSSSPLLEESLERMARHPRCRKGGVGVLELPELIECFAEACSPLLRHLSGSDDVNMVAETGLLAPIWRMIEAHRAAASPKLSRMWKAMVLHEASLRQGASRGFGMPPAQYSGVDLFAKDIGIMRDGWWVTRLASDRATAAVVRLVPRSDLRGILIVEKECRAQSVLIGRFALQHGLAVICPYNERLSQGLVDFVHTAASRFRVPIGLLADEDVDGLFAFAFLTGGDLLLRAGRQRQPRVSWLDFGTAGGLNRSLVELRMRAGDRRHLAFLSTTSTLAAHRHHPIVASLIERPHVLELEALASRRISRVARIVQKMVLNWIDSANPEAR